jgi:hypothetical protein
VLDVTARELEETDVVLLRRDDGLEHKRVGLLSWERRFVQKSSVLLQKLCVLLQKSFEFVQKASEFVQKYDGFLQQASQFL